MRRQAQWPLTVVGTALYPPLVHRHAVTLHTTSPHQVALMELRFAALVISNSAPMVDAPQKKARRSGPSKLTQLTLEQSGGFIIDLGEVVLSSLGAIGDELAEIFARGLGPRHQHFTACAQ